MSSDVPVSSCAGLTQQPRLTLMMLTVAKASGPSPPKSASLPGKLRTTPASSSKTQSQTQPSTPKSSSKGASKAGSSGAATPLNVAQQDLAGLHLDDETDEAERERERERFKENPGLSMKQEELIAKVKKDEAESGKQSISLIVVGRSCPDSPCSCSSCCRPCRCGEIDIDGSVTV